MKSFPKIHGFNRSLAFLGTSPPSKLLDLPLFVHLLVSEWNVTCWLWGSFSQGFSLSRLPLECKAQAVWSRMEL